MISRRLLERTGRELGVRDLARRRTLRVGSPRGGVVIRVERGLLLVTQAGDPEDHVLAAGGELRLTGRGLVVAEALEASRVTVAEARAELPGRLGFRAIVTS